MNFECPTDFALPVIFAPALASLPIDYGAHTLRLLQVAPERSTCAHRLSFPFSFSVSFTGSNKEVPHWLEVRHPPLHPSVHYHISAAHGCVRCNAGDEWWLCGSGCGCSTWKQSRSVADRWHGCCSRKRS